MTTTAIYDEFSKLVTSFSDAQGVGTAYPGLHFKPPSQGEWLELLAFWNGNKNYGLSNAGPSIEQGFFRLLVCSRSEGLMKAQALAEKVVAAFPKGVVFAGARVETQPSISGPFQEDDKIVVPVTIRWRATR